VNQSIIKTLSELETTAARNWWEMEDRFAWRDDLLRTCESRDFIPLKGCLKNMPQSIAIRIWDEDLATCFTSGSFESEDSEFDKIILETRNLNKDDLLAMALRPGFWLSENWSVQEEPLRAALQKARLSQALVVRCGFLSEQAEILMTAELGFSGVQIHAAELDVFQLQFLIELARDCRLTPMVSVENQKQLETVIGTDAPHIILCCMKGGGYEAALRFVQQSIPQLPENCTKLLITGSTSQTDIQLFGKLGLNAVLSFG
jgi:hypothetical protein